MLNNRPVIGITMGDAAGIGPEIIIKSLIDNQIYLTCKPVVIGDSKVLEKAASLIHIDVEINRIDTVSEAVFQPGMINCLDMDLLSNNWAIGKVSAETGNAAFHYVAKAVELAKNGDIDAICTAPLNKEALHLGGHSYPGHTEILADLTQTTDYSMMLSTPNLKVIHLTTHVGLRRAIDLINPERTYKVIKLAHETLKAAGNDHPKIGVCGINPHAGENGLFGEGEEEEKLAPGIRMAQSEGIDVLGPLPADTLFFRAIRGDFDIVVACYHDQGHGPIKVLGIEAGVNITVGLNGGIVRTSVDHGTAFDIAGRNVADERSMKEAIKAACELAPRNSYKA